MPPLATDIVIQHLYCIKAQRNLKQLAAVEVCVRVDTTTIDVLNALSVFL